MARFIVRIAAPYSLSRLIASRAVYLPPQGESKNKVLHELATVQPYRHRAVPSRFSTSTQSPARARLGVDAVSVRRPPPSTAFASIHSPVRGLNQRTLYRPEGSSTCTFGALQAGLSFSGTVPGFATGTERAGAAGKGGQKCVLTGSAIDPGKAVAQVAAPAELLEDLRPVGLHRH